MPAAGIELVLPERYVDRGPIGAGGMGEVRRVFDTRLGVELAMKVLGFGSASDLSRRDAFVVEARLTAQLRHPAVVAVQDLGELADGRPWFTMEIVTGATLAELEPELGLERLVELLAQVADAADHAHGREVVHRDLKPANIMVGAFGEARVVDWGIALWEGLGARPGAGTPTWMAPEQRTARAEAIGPPTDVYAIGGLISWIMTNRRHERSAGLHALADAARHPDPRARPSAREVARSLRAWLDSQRRWALADEGVERADALRPAIDELRRRSRELRDQHALAAAEVYDHAPLEVKRPLWALQAEADRLASEAEVQEAAWVQALTGNLTHVVEHTPSHLRLAGYHAERLLDAERAGRPLEATRHEQFLRAHDRGGYATLVGGRGTWELHTEVPARVRLWRLEDVDRRRIPVGEAHDLGMTPLTAVELAAGSWLAELTAPGRVTVRLPIWIPRGGALREFEPGTDRMHRLVLPRSLPDGFCYVPSGWFEPGGDPEATDPVRLGRVWVGGFLLARDPVTVGEYCRFLDAMPEPELDALLPRHGADSGSSRALVERGPAGFRSSEPGVGHDVPVTGITWPAMQRFIVWYAGSTGLAARLPHGVEWERACRGADRRCYATGDQLEPTSTVMVSSTDAMPHKRTVEELVFDVSPYGVRGLTGNVSDAMGNAWTHAGGRIDAEGRLDAHELAPPGSMPEVRGGAYSSNRVRCRAASRVALRWSDRLPAVGFRLALDLDG